MCIRDSVKDALFGLDEVTFYTPEWPESISKDSVVSSAASPDGKYYAADVYNDEDELYSLYVWSQDGSVEVVNNIYAHEIYYISDKGTIIYKETETINDTGKTGGLKLSMAEITNDKSSGSLIGKTDTIAVSYTHLDVYKRQIQKANVTNYFEELVSDLDGVLYGYYFAELAEYYGRENLDAADMINLLYVAFKALVNKSLPNELVRYIYEIRLIAVNGECPDFFSCAGCGSEKELQLYSYKENRCV